MEITAEGEFVELLFFVLIRSTTQTSSTSSQTTDVNFSPSQIFSFSQLEQQPSSIGSPPPMVPRSKSPKSVDAEVQTIQVPPPRRPTPNPGATRTIIDLTTPEHASDCPNCNQPGPAGPPVFDLANYMDLDMQNQEARAWQ